MSITVNIYYSGKNGAARKFAEEMVSSGTVAAIRDEKGNLQYEYFYPVEDTETVLLIDSWVNQAAIDMHHRTPMMQKIMELRDRLFSDAESRRDEWNRLKPFFEEVMGNEEENIIIVSHGDLLSVFNAMFLGLDVESPNQAEMFGLAGGVSFMFENNDGKRFIKKISDMSYIR